MPVQATRPGVNREPSGRSRGRVSQAFALTTASECRMQARRTAPLACAASAAATRKCNSASMMSPTCVALDMGYLHPPNGPSQLGMSVSRSWDLCHGGARDRSDLGIEGGTAASPAGVAVSRVERTRPPHRRNRVESPLRDRRRHGSGTSALSHFTPLPPYRPWTTTRKRLYYRHTLHAG